MEKKEHELNWKTKAAAGELSAAACKRRIS